MRFWFWTEVWIPFPLTCSPKVILYEDFTFLRIYSRCLEVRIKKNWSKYQNIKYQNIHRHGLYMLAFWSQANRKWLHTMSYHEDEHNTGRAIYHDLWTAALVTPSGPVYGGTKLNPSTLETGRWGAQDHPQLYTKFKARQGCIRPPPQNQTEGWALRGAWAVTTEYRKAIWAFPVQSRARQRAGKVF